MSIHPLTKKSPLEIFSTRVDEANSFVPGEFLAATPSGLALADNADRDKPAIAWVAAADPDRYWIVSARGEIVEWNDHGFSIGAYRWLDTAGGTTATEPTGAAVEVVQPVLLVLDADHVQLFPERPITF